MLTGASAGVWLAVLGNEVAAWWVERALVALGGTTPSIEVLTLGATLVLACLSGILALVAGAGVEDETRGDRLGRHGQHAQGGTSLHRQTGLRSQRRAVPGFGDRGCAKPVAHEGGSSQRPGRSKLVRLAPLPRIRAIRREWRECIEGAA